jgi:hypothetical protein
VTVPVFFLTSAFWSTYLGMLDIAFNGASANLDVLFALMLRLFLY